MDDVTIALALHVLAIVHWIGGLAFVTLIVLPLARIRSTAGRDLHFSKPWNSALPRRSAFQFRLQARLAYG